MAKKILRPDTKGRICLGNLAKGISGYKAIMNESTREIILKPYAEVQLREKWLFENEEALSSIKRGLEQSSRKETIYKGNFAQYSDENE